MRPQATTAKVRECSFPAFLLRGFWDEVEKRGVSHVQLEQASGAPYPRSGDFSATISESAMHSLFEAAASLCGDPALGLTAGRAIGASGFHLIGHLSLACTSLTQMRELIVQAFPQLGDHGPVLEAVGGGRVRFGFRRGGGRSGPGPRVTAQLTAVLLHDVALHYFRPRSREAPRVQLPFSTPADRGPYDRIFPGGVDFDSQGTFVVFRSAALARHRNGADPWLVEHLFKLALDTSGVANERDGWSVRVRRALRNHPAPRLANVSMIAQQLGTSTRGLSRRLAREGITASQLVDEALFERAQALLLRPSATSAQVAEALGYAELSSFFRAFRRWSGGLTPNAYRRHAGRRTGL